MHELWLCKNIIDIVSQNIPDKKRIIKKIYLEIGELAAVDKSALLFSFNIVAQESIAKNAILEIIPILGKAKCNNCQSEIEIKQYSETCSYCHSSSLSIIQGEEVKVKSMEIE